MASSSSSSFSFPSYPYRFPGYQAIQTFFETVDDYPGPRCGHTLTAVGNRLILFGGITSVRSDGSTLPGISLQGVTNSVHCFNILTRKWTRVCPDGEPPSPRVGHAAAVIGNRVFIQGGIGLAGSSNGDLYILDVTGDKFEWQRVLVRGKAPTPGPRYGHVMGLVDHRLVIFGGKIGNEILADTWALDTTRGFAWERLSPFGNLPCGRMYAAASTRDDGYFVLCGGRDYSGVPLGDSYGLQMLSDGHWVWTAFPGGAASQRCQHTAVFVQPRLHVIGGVLSEAHLIDAISSVTVLDTSSRSGVWLDRFGPDTYNHGQYFTPLTRRCRHAAASVGGCIYVYGGIGGSGEIGVLLEDLLVSEDDIMPPPISMGRLMEAPATLPTVHAAFYASVDEGYAQLRQRTVVISNETVENRACLASQLTLNEVETERRRMSDMMSYSSMPPFFRQKSTQDLLEKVISTLLKPHSWKNPATRIFFLSYAEVEELCRAAIQIFMKEPTVLELKVPIKVFGDLHGQFEDLMNLFRVYGEPSVKGDIASIDYLFLGDYVDRGKHSLETIILLLALKVKYPENIHLIRGNHESSGMNLVYGFTKECTERMGEVNGDQAWKMINIVFNHLPLAALIEKKIFCVHGGIGEIESVEEVAKIQRPIQSDCEGGSVVLNDLLWSDPTENDSILGIQKNSRGNHIVSFGPDIVEAFCERNNLDMIIRAHECVMDGFKRFAQGRLMTVFSAPNYCGHTKNVGAILVIGRDWVIYPKLIYPESPPFSSSENSPDIASIQERDSEVISFPVGREPIPGYERGSTSSQTP